MKHGYFANALPMEVKYMSGRNNTPKNNGPASSPSRLDQFGDKAVQQEKQEAKEHQSSKNNC
jgi:hypothetical protein